MWPKIKNKYTQILRKEVKSMDDENFVELFIFLQNHIQTRKGNK